MLSEIIASRQVTYDGKETIIYGVVQIAGEWRSGRVYKLIAIEVTVWLSTEAVLASTTQTGHPVTDDKIQAYLSRTWRVHLNVER